MKRVTVFSNLTASSTLPLKRTGGKVVLYNSYLAQDEEEGWTSFTQDCANKLWGTRPMSIRIFNSAGGELTSVEEVLNGEILFVSRGEDFDTLNQGIDLYSQVSQLTARIELLEQTIFDLKRHNQEVLQQDQVVVADQDRLDIIEEEPVANSSVPIQKEMLVVFVNTKSGGQLGRSLIPRFKDYLPADAIFTLGEVDPVPILTLLKDEPNVKIITCGGDGTVKWILESIDKVGFANAPPVGVLPLGTGNDIARVFNWGGGFASNDSISKFLSHVTHSQGVKLDRWSVTIDESFLDKKQTTAPKKFIMSNYFSFGIDAKIALDFHNKRNDQPNLFTSQAMNKFWYFGYGLSNMVESAMDAKDMTRIVTVEVDGRRVDTTEKFEGIVILNLPSYAAGCDLWGSTRDNHFALQSINDGMIEVCGIRNTSHLASIQNGSNAVRLAQGSTVKLTYLSNNPKGLAFQIDGEPWNQIKSCVIEIKFHNQANMLARYRV